MDVNSTIATFATSCSSYNTSLFGSKQCVSFCQNTLVNQRSSSRYGTRMQVNVSGAAPVNNEQGLKEAMRRALDGMRDKKKKVTLLGSTGSIGTQTLDIVSTCPDSFEIEGLAAGSNVAMLIEQARQFQPKIVGIRNESKVDELKRGLADAGVKCRVVGGSEGIVEVASEGEAETVVTGIVGCAGLLPTVAAIKAGKDIALANKETLIAGGPVVVPLVKEYGVQMTAADSEHSAIFQCLQGAPPGALKKIILTASGGAFRDWKKEDLEKVTLADALKHPNWSMGAKSKLEKNEFLLVRNRRHC